MKLTLLFDHRFMRDPSGHAFSQTSYNYELFARRYLSVFDEVRVVSRFEEESSLNPDGKRLEGPGVVHVPVGNWRGALGYLGRVRSVDRVIAQELSAESAVIMIAPGTIGQKALPKLRRNKRPYGVEVVGDPYDVFAPDVMQHPARPFLRAWSTRQLQSQCIHAATVAYVNTSALPNRYPASRDAYTTSYSSIELLDEHFRKQVRVGKNEDNPFRIVTIGSLALPYKGVDVLIDAADQLVRSGFNVSVSVLGEGAYLVPLRAQVARLGLENRITFLGHVPAGDAVRTELDNADMFVLASRTEGLPRAMIEAMARGLPCIGTDVGGIPELLPGKEMVPPNDPGLLATTISEVIKSPKWQEEMSDRNIRVAERYKADTLHAKRVAHYQELKERTRRWQVKIGRRN